MCQFLQSQVWNEETQNTINRLTEDSAKVAESLSRWSELQDTILENQMTTLEYQKEIMANGSALSLALESSRENAKQLMEEFRTSTDEQRALIFSIFDRVSKLQSLVVSEVSWFYTVIFYAGTLVLVYVMTATRRTADSRFSLLFIFTLNAVVERVICSMSLVGIDNPSATMFFPENGMESLPEVISNRIWLSRKISLLSATILVVYNVWNFKDYNMINNAILKDIQMQNKELRNALQAIQASNETLLTDTTDSKAICTVDSDSDSDTLSFNSTQTDRTWMLTHEPSDDDDDVTDIEDDFLDDVLSAENSGNGSITDMSIMQQPVSIVENVSSDNSLATQKKPGRPKGSRSSTPRRSLTPQLPVNHGYNLRNRSLMNHTMNPILETETPEVFARRVLEVAASAEVRLIFEKKRCIHNFQIAKCMCSNIFNLCFSAKSARLLSHG